MAGPDLATQCTRIELEVQGARDWCERWVHGDLKRFPVTYYEQQKARLEELEASLATMRWVAANRDRIKALGEVN